MGHLAKSYNVVAIPYPGRGHINPLMHLCKRMAIGVPTDLTITFVVTEEWLGLIESEPKPDNIRFATIPNLIPLDKKDEDDVIRFVNDIQTKMQGPVEQLLHRMKIPVINLLMCDTSLVWGVDLGKKMDIPVASFFVMSAMMFSIVYHRHLLENNGHVGDNILEKDEEEIIDYIPGVAPIRVADLGTFFRPINEIFLKTYVKSVFMAAKAQFLILISVYELESQAIDVLRSTLAIPVYAIGPAIPYFELKDEGDYMKWLDNQVEGSVLYISQGSFLSVSSDQLDEIIAGVHDSGVPYIWIARGDDKSRYEQKGGLVIPWCDQLKVLSHVSVGGFWTHCGMNSITEGAFSGKPMLTFPIGSDQFPQSKMVAEDWKMGMRVQGKLDALVTRQQIAQLIISFMDKESEQGKEMTKRATEVSNICQQAITRGGSAHTQIDSIITHLLPTV